MLNVWRNTHIETGKAKDKIQVLKPKVLAEITGLKPRYITVMTSKIIKNYQR